MSRHPDVNKFTGHEYYPEVLDRSRSITRHKNPKKGGTIYDLVESTCRRIGDEMATDAIKTLAREGNLAGEYIRETAEKIEEELKKNIRAYNDFKN